MKIALPVSENKLCLHFGHSDEFLFIEIDDKTKKILKKESLTPPPHSPGIIPPWVKSHGADTVICGGMGSRAQALFNQTGVTLIVGVTETDPDKIISDYLNGTLASGKNACDH